MSTISPNTKIVEAEVQDIELTLNRFPMLFLFHCTCLKCCFPWKEWRVWMGNCSFLMSLAFEVNNLFVSWKYEQFFIRFNRIFLVVDIYCLLNSLTSQSSKVAHYSKKEHLILAIFSFGITIALSRKLTGRKYSTQSWKMKEKIAK